jgi:hypothetical protein
MKKNWLLPAAAVVLAVVYVVCFTGWFKPKTMQIYHTNRDIFHLRHPRGGQLPGLRFVLNQPFKLTSIEVFPPGAQTNPEALPLWHLISDSNSEPVKSFFYGQPVRGLKPAVSGSLAQPLSNDVPYHLIITAGRIKGEHDFELK